MSARGTDNRAGLTGAGAVAQVRVSHIPWAFALDDAPSLPVTGELHPLRRERARWLRWANLGTLVLGLVIFASYVGWSHRKPSAPPVARQVKIVRYTDLGVPPSIAKPVAPQINVAQAVAKIPAPPPTIAVPEPVADEKATTQTIATKTEMAEALAPITFAGTGGGAGTGDSLVVQTDIDTAPAPDEFVAVDEEPVRVSIGAPDYPQVARAAGIEGTVLVRVLVGKNGRVKDVIFIDGPAALRKSAEDCARTAVFRPAQVDHKPLEVWVNMPVTFKLRG
jgi:periplasmic protein TonB